MSAIDFLLQAQNADGGWGYRMRGMSYVEPTAAVVLALPDSAERARGRALLLSLQHVDGGWGIASIDSESGWMTSWAVHALSKLSDAREAVARGVDWLLAAQGLKITDPESRRVILELHHIDSALAGWSWQPGDASWVQPTALAMIALASTERADAPRMREGVAFLIDRAVSSGGWNIGNPQMIGTKIILTVQDTAVGLLALRAVNASSDDALVARAIVALRDLLTRAQTPAELAWGIYALANWRIDVRDLIVRLYSLQKANGSWSDNPFITAIALLANKT